MRPSAQSRILLAVLAIGLMLLHPVGICAVSNGSAPASHPCCPKPAPAQPGAPSPCCQGIASAASPAPETIHFAIAPDGVSLSFAENYPEASVASAPSLGAVECRFLKFHQLLI
jgi:hypothetical protein